MTTTIQPKRIKHTYVEHFDPQGNSLGFLNELENIDLRTQIMEADVDGYYMMFNDKRIELPSNGDMSAFPRGMYDLMMQQCAIHFTAEKTKKALEKTYDFIVNKLNTKDSITIRYSDGDSDYQEIERVLEQLKNEFYKVNTESQTGKNYLMREAINYTTTITK